MRRLTTATVIVAYRDSGDGYRQSALAYVLERVWRGAARTVEVVDSGSPVFSRGESFNVGAEQADADVCVFTDADVVPDTGAVKHAIRAAHVMGVTAYPYTRYVRLSLDGTLRIYDGLLPRAIDVEWDSRDSVGGIFICRRDHYLACGGCDPRFVGWGFEDVAWSATSATILGDHARVDTDLLHLWHPWDPHSGPADRGRGEQRIYEANTELCDRYTAAIGDRDLIRSIRSEA